MAKLVYYSFTYLGSIAEQERVGPSGRYREGMKGRMAFLLPEIPIER